VDAAPPLYYGLPVSTVSSHQRKSLPGTHHCPAARQGNTCGRCRACWNPQVKIVDFPLKWVSPAFGLSRTLVAIHPHSKGE
jgi:hypothetical protein